MHIPNATCLLNNRHHAAARFRRVLLLPEGLALADRRSSCLGTVGDRFPPARIRTDLTPVSIQFYAAQRIGKSATAQEILR